MVKFQFSIFSLVSYCRKRASGISTNDQDTPLYLGELQTLDSYEWNGVIYGTREYPRGICSRLSDNEVGGSESPRYCR